MINLLLKFRSLRRSSVLTGVCALAVISLLPVISATGAPASGQVLYAVAETHVPVLNTPDFRSVFGGRDGRTLTTDRCGQIRPLEFIAMPRTVFRIEAVTGNGKSTIYRVTTDDYPYASHSGYFIDARAVRTTTEPPPSRQRRLPDRKTVLANLFSAQGSLYVWGGNRRDGIPEMLSLYPPATRLDRKMEDHWALRGLDCSGLLYEATGGFTPRNTSSLIEYGERVPIEGLGVKQMAAQVQPLDLIVWKGHVMIVYDRNTIIESRLDCTGKSGGVRLRGLKPVLQDLLRTRIPLNDYLEGERTGKRGFVIRRWYPDKTTTPLEY